MKTDKIFYTLFRAFPDLLFELLGQPTELAQVYEFKSVEIKELAFRLDGVFLPSDEYPSQPLYFVEVQFQKDDDFYWRFITEVFLYLRQYKPNRLWQAVAVWESRSLEKEIPLPYQYMVDNQLKRVYLDELSDNEGKSLGLEIVRLVVGKPQSATEQVQLLIEQTQREIPDPALQQQIIELIEKIIIYKLPKLSRQELEQMFTLTEWKKTRFYQDVQQETKLNSVSKFLKLGLTVEQIAEALELDIELVKQEASKQSSENS